jgi:hypothetical protein
MQLRQNLHSEGRPNPVEPIDLHGFVVTDSLTLLGMNVKRELNNEN